MFSVSTATRARPPWASLPRLQPRARDARRELALRETLRAFVWTRLLVAVVAIVAAAGLTPTTLPVNGSYGPRSFSGWPLEGLFRHAFEPLVRWDAVWYLTIAHHGYTGAAGEVGQQAGFFPLYPLVTRALANPFGSSPGTLVVVAQLVSLTCLLGALYLLYRLVELELGRDHARIAVSLLAVYPGSYYFSAPFTESMFLLLSVAAFYAARRERWAWAGLLAAAASSTRLAGVMVAGGLAVLYLYGPRERPPDDAGSGRLRARYRVRRDSLWLGLGAAGPLLYSAFLAVSYGNPLAWSSVQQANWNRQWVNPLETAWHGGLAAWRGGRELVQQALGHASAAHFDRANDVLVILQFGALAFAVVAIAGVLRRLPPAYGAYCVGALLLILSTADPREPLTSVLRYVMVLFPMFMWLAMVCRERRLTHRLVLTSSALLLVLLTAAFASEQVRLA
jgi:Mannosyltransferase (PIG-V)